jgi:hypothetical protein
MAKASRSPTEVDRWPCSRRYPEDPVERLRASGDLEPAEAELADLPEPLPLLPGCEPPSAVLARLRRDER